MCFRAGRGGSAAAAVPGRRRPRGARGCCGGVPGSEGVDAVFQRAGDVHGEYVGRPADDDVRVEGRQTAPAVGAAHGLRIAERGGERGDKVWRSVRTEAGLPERSVRVARRVSGWGRVGEGVDEGGDQFDGRAGAEAGVSGGPVRLGDVVQGHHWSSGSGSRRRRAFWSGLESRTRGIRGSLPWLHPQARWRGTVVQAGSPPSARRRGVMKSTSTVSGVGALVTSVPRFVARVRGQAWEPEMRGPCGLRC